MRWQSTRVVERQWCLGRLKTVFTVRGSDGVMGRFGGGWNWKLGFQAGGRTVIFSLLVAELRVSWA
jgi:hypothetical protein